MMTSAREAPKEVHFRRKEFFRTQIKLIKRKRVFEAHANTQRSHIRESSVVEKRNNSM